MHIILAGLHVRKSLLVYRRFESFNSFIRVHNIFGNKSAPSKDIARRFGELEQLRHICEGGLVLHGHRYNIISYPMIMESLIIIHFTVAAKVFRLCILCQQSNILLIVFQCVMLCLTRSFINLDP